MCIQCIVYMCIQCIVYMCIQCIVYICMEMYIVIEKVNTSVSSFHFSGSV